jgi:hypothetical protein
MKRRFTLLVLLCIIAVTSNAQQIKPYDLIQLYKFFQLKEDKFSLSAYQYLHTVDTCWKPTANPIFTEKDATADFGYVKNGKYYMPETYHLMMTRTYGPPLQNAIVYSFKELDLWTSYLGQMTLMNATKLGSMVQDGGTRTIYTVNGIAFILVDFPPGVQGQERTFQVSILTNNSSK